MALSLNKTKLDNLATDIWKSAERLRGKFKVFEYQSVILPIIVIADVVADLTDSVDPQGYVKDMRRRDKELAKGWGQIATPPFRPDFRRREAK